MALKDLFFTIFAKDKTGPAFDGVNRRFKETETRAERLKRRLDGIGKSMRNVGAAGTVGSAGLAAMFRGSIDLYDEQARSEAKVAQAIKATGAAAGFTASELFRQASAMQDLTRIGDEDILNNVTAQFLTFKNVTGETFMRAQWGAMDLATVLDGDLKSASIMLGKALNDPVKGLSAMSRAGVTFGESQQKIIKDLAQTGQIAEAQKIILDEIASAYGGQARAAAAVGAGVLDQWRNTWGDIKEIVGSVLLDIIRTVLPALRSVSEAFSGLSPRAQRLTVVVGALAVALPPLIASLGLVAMGVAAIGGPVTAVVAGIAALVGVTVALATASGGAAQALAAERAATLELSAALSGGVGMSASTARAKLAEAQARLVNARAVLEEERVLAEAATRRGGRRVARDIGRVADPERLRAASDQVSQIEANIKRLEMVIATGGTSVAEKLSAVEVSAFDAGSALSGVFAAASSTAQDVQSDHAWDHVSGDLKSIIKTADSVGDAFERMRDRILDAAFDAAVDPALDGLFTGLRDTIGGTARSSGGGGVFGSLISAGAGLLGVPGFDTGGAFTVRGRAGIDRNLATVRLSEGEDVEVTRRGQGGGRTINLTMNIQTNDVESFRRSRAQLATEVRGMLAFAERGA